MRECLNEPNFDIDLDTLANQVGMSRFQALRAFKRRYGLPPHAYQMCVRLGLARHLLTQGATLAEVALCCGFSDQSHLNRHFKRAFGVTPMRYARGIRSPNQRAGAGHTASDASDHDVSAILARADYRCG